MSTAEESPSPVAGPGSASVALFLRQVSDHGLCRLGTADYLRVERLLASREGWKVGELAASLAALLATGEESWRRIHNLAVETLGVAPAERELGGVTPGDGVGPEEGDGKVPPETVGESGAEKRRWRQLIPVVSLLTTLALAVLLSILWREEPAVSPTSAPPSATESAEETESRWRLEVLEEERTITSLTPTVRKLGWRDALAFAAGFVLLTLALRWWCLPEASRRHRQQALDDDRQRRIDQRAEESRQGYVERETLARELLEAGRLPLVPFQVSERPAVSWRAVDDAAVVLARLQEEIPGRDDLDAAATIDATVEAGGRAVPVYERGRLQATLLVLVDDEGDDHPWLGGFERVLDRWQRRGVRMLRFGFCEQPDPVTPHPRGAAISFDVLSRRYAGLPMIIFSRRLTHRGTTAAGADWTRRLEAWPVKAWIDPDPTPLKEPIRRPGFAQDVKGLKRLGFARFGLDEQDLPLLARYLAEAGTGIRPPRRRPLPKITPEVESALRAWAVAAARVPEAGWDLLEEFRRELREEVGRWLPERRHVALLIRWINERQGTLSRRHQAILEIEDEEVERLRREQVAKDRTLPMPQRLLTRVAGMLLKQLEATRPGEKLQFLELRWELKRAELELVASPEKVLERLARFRATAVDSLAARTAESLFVEGALEPEDRERLARVWLPEKEEPGEVAEGVSAKELFLGHTKIWLRACVVVTVAFALGFHGAFALDRWVASGSLATSFREFFLTQSVVSRADGLPRTSQLVRADGLPETRYRPALVEIPAGSFLMGSPDTEEGRDSDEQLHSVTITRGFYLASTEVTQAQYQAVVGTNPSRDTECGGKCPVGRVSWFEAIIYANRLSELENMELCYEIDGKEVTWPRRLQCTGYRLPTEAEWEYAARAGTRDRYVGTDSPQDVCSYANVKDVAFECDDGHADLAPTMSYQPNGFDLYDMTGNVWEWVWDWLDDYDSGVVSDPIGPTSGQYRGVRGGSFLDVPRYARVANRRGWGPSGRDSDLGFRVARSLL